MPQQIGDKDIVILEAIRREGDDGLSVGEVKKLANKIGVNGQSALSRLKNAKPKLIRIIKIGGRKTAIATPEKEVGW